MTTNVTWATRGTRVPVVPTAVVIGILAVAAGLGALWQERATPRTNATVTGPAIEQVAPSEVESLVVNARLVEVLRHKSGLHAIDLVRTAAFGWDGLTVHEVLRDPVFLREMRRDPTLSPLDLVRMEARGA